MLRLNLDILEHVQVSLSAISSSVSILFKPFSHGPCGWPNMSWCLALLWVGAWPSSISGFQEDEEPWVRVVFCEVDGALLYRERNQPISQPIWIFRNRIWTFQVLNCSNVLQPPKDPTEQERNGFSTAAMFPKDQCKGGNGFSTSKRPDKMKRNVHLQR